MLKKHMFFSQHLIKKKSFCYFQNTLKKIKQTIGWKEK
jgi:hypothetical protein